MAKVFACNYYKTASSKCKYLHDVVRYDYYITIPINSTTYNTYQTVELSNSKMVHKQKHLYFRRYRKCDKRSHKKAKTLVSDTKIGPTRKL